MEEVPALITNLRRLRQLEQEIAAQERIVTSALDAYQQAKRDEVAARAQAKEREAERFTLQQREKQLEGMIHEIDEKLAKLEEQLLSSSSSQMRQAGERQMVSMKEQRDVLETEGLEILDQLEKLDATIQGLEARAEAANTRMAKQKDDAAKLKTEQEPVIAGLRAERQDLLASMETDVATQYEDLCQQVGDAIAEVADGCCLGCGEQIAENTVTVMKVGHSAVHCQGCQRILIPQISN